MNARVSTIKTENGRARGVVLDGGEELIAPIVVTTCHPKITFLDQLNATELPADFVNDISTGRRAAAR